MSYTDTLNRMASRVAARLVAAYTARQSGDLTDAEFVQVATAYLDAGDAAATALADRALAAFLESRQGHPVAALGMAAPVLDHEPRVRELIGEDAPGEQWRSYGRGSALATTQTAYGDAMRTRDIPGWTRVPDAGACQLCRDLAGPVLPASVRMYHHDGCGCTQKPILEGDTR